MSFDVHADALVHLDHATRGRTQEIKAVLYHPPGVSESLSMSLWLKLMWAVWRKAHISQSDP